MTVFQENYNATGVFGILEEATATLKGIRAKLDKEQYSQMNIKLTRLGEVLSSVDPDFLGQEAVNNATFIKGQLSDYVNQLNYWIQNDDNNYLTYATNNLQNCVSSSQFSTLAICANLPQTKKEQLDIRESYIALAKEMDKSQAEMRKGIEDLTDSRTKILAEVIALKNQIKQTQENANEEFEKQISDLQSENKILKDQLKNEVDAIHTEQRETAKKTLEEIKSIYKFASDKAVTGSFDDAAATEKSSFTFWRTASIGFYICAIIWVILTLVEPKFFGAINNITIIRILIVTSLFIALGTYCAYQSYNHRNQYKRLQKFSLEIKSFATFIEKLPQEQQHELTVELTKNVFGNEDLSNDSEPNFTIKEITQLAQLFKS